MTAVHVTDAAVLRRAFGAFPTGVTAVAALVDGAPEGIAASSFTSVSLDPPLVSVCIAHSSTTWPRLSTAPRLGISVLSEGQAAIARRLASRDPGRFDDVPWESTPSESVRIKGSAAWLEAGVEQVVRAGDHDIVVLRVLDLELDHDLAPLVFHGSAFRRLHPGDTSS